MTSCGAEETEGMWGGGRKRRTRPIAEEEGAMENSTGIISFSGIHVSPMHPTVFHLETPTVMDL